MTVGTPTGFFDYIPKNSSRFRQESCDQSFFAVELCEVEFNEVRRLVFNLVIVSSSVCDECKKEAKSPMLITDDEDRAQPFYLCSDFSRDCFESYRRKLWRRRRKKVGGGRNWAVS